MTLKFRKKFLKYKAKFLQQFPQNSQQFPQNSHQQGSGNKTPEKIFIINSKNKKFREKIKYLFPLPPKKHNSKFDRMKLKLTNISLYSVTPHDLSKQIIKIMRKNIPVNLKTLVCTDGTANVGGDLINFAQAFKTVNGVEIDKITFQALKHNVKLYGLVDVARDGVHDVARGGVHDVARGGKKEKNNRVRLYNCDYTSCHREIVQDCVFLDPPWGGVDYKVKGKIDLYLGKYSIGKFVKKLNAKWIFLKVPMNFNIKKFTNDLDLNVGFGDGINVGANFDKVNTLRVYRLRNMNIIFINNV